MSAIGFTGAREVNELQALYVRTLVGTLGADTYVSGACTGVDETVARAVARFWPAAHNVILVPTNRSRISPGFLDEMLAAGADVVFMPDGTNYADRNQEIVNRSDRLVGLPPFAEDHPACRRSGTWQTIRMARRIGMPLDVRILTEEVAS